MSNHDVIERDDSLTHTGVDEATTVFVDFLEAEFPDWTFAIDETATWSGDARQLWIATQDGHHPQSALTAGKLHRRLSDYESRTSARYAGNN